MNVSETKPNTHQTDKSWQQRLKDESWEAELLVSAVAIFGAFQLFSIADWTVEVFINILHPSQYEVAYFIVFFGLIAFCVLAAMFVIHFVIRGLWVGLLGLNSVFPDYGKSSPNYPPLLMDKMLAYLPKMSESIDDIDDLCSTIFATAFCILFNYLYMSLMITIVLFLYNILSLYLPLFVLLIPIFILGTVSVLSFVLSLLIRKESLKTSKRFIDLVFIVNRINNAIVFGPFSKLILQVIMLFSTNYQNRKTLIWLVLLFASSGLIGASLIVSSKNNDIMFLMQHKQYFQRAGDFAPHYASNNQDISLLIAPEIQSDLIDKNVIRLFIPVFSHESKRRSELCPELKDARPSRQSPNSGSEYLVYNKSLEQCTATYHSIRINGESVVSTLKKTRHPITQQFGVYAFIDIESLSKGEHLLEVSKKLTDDYRFDWRIPFYVVRTMDGKR